jgi:hypothetical protein
MTSAAQKRALAKHRRRTAENGLVRVEVRVRPADATLIKSVAEAINRDPANREAVERAVAPAAPRRSLWDLMQALPDVSGPEFDEAFEIPREQVALRDVEF